jgi:uncharacterized membrane protein YhaH (DUF805 family)
MNSNLLSKTTKNFQPRHSRGWFWLILMAVMIIAVAVAPAMMFGALFAMSLGMLIWTMRGLKSLSISKGRHHVNN